MEQRATPAPEHPTEGQVDPGGLVRSSQPGPTGAYVIVFFSSPISTAELFPHLLCCLSDPVYVVADLVPEPVIRVLNVLDVVIPAVITEPCYCP